MIDRFAIPAMFAFWLVITLIAGSIFSGCAGFPRYPLINPGLGQETPHDPDDVQKRDTGAAERFGDFGQAADLASTVYALEALGFEEENPLASDMGTAGIVAFKIAGNWLLYEIADRCDESTAKAVHYIRGIFGFSAAAINVSRY